MRIAKERKSSVLASNAVHHRIDSLTSIVALIAILGSHVLQNVSWLDPVGGLLVSMMVVRAGWGNSGAALLELADVGMAEEMKLSIRKAISKALAGNDFSSGRIAGSEVEVQDIQGVKAGQNYSVNIQLAVPGEWSVAEIRTVEDVVRERAGAKVRGVRRVRVRFVAKATDMPDFSNEFVGPDVSPRSSPEPEDEEGHSRQHHAGHEKVSLNGDVKRRR